MAGPDAITSTLLRAKPRQLPASLGRGFLPPPRGKAASSAHPRHREPIARQANRSENIHLML